jgi:hypothetical protein
MRLFQNSGLYPNYISRLRSLTKGCGSFSELLQIFLNDRYGACHFLKPVLEGDSGAFFTNGDDILLQQQWAREHGLKPDVSLPDILRMQIEDHRAEVFYNLDPMRYQSDFIKNLPGCVKKSIAWRAAPSPNADFSAYDAVVCNFQSILAGYRELGWRAEYFSPAHDPEMDNYSRNNVRPIDVLFVGGYSRHHRQRVKILESVASLRTKYNIVYHLDRSRLTRLAESLPGYLLPLGSHRRPADIRAVDEAPIFGRDLYEAISRAKIVLNGAVDMAGSDRGNMRCFEAMGCGALMVSDAGIYPDGLTDGVSMLAYDNSTDVKDVITEVLAKPDKLQTIADTGSSLMRDRYSKHRQWDNFELLLSAL